MKTSKLIRITGDTAADVDAAIEMLCTFGLPIGVSTQGEITEEIAEYMVTETWIDDSIHFYDIPAYNLSHEDFCTEFALSIVDKLTL